MIKGAEGHFLTSKIAYNASQPGAKASEVGLFNLLSVPVPVLRPVPAQASFPIRPFARLPGAPGGLRLLEALRLAVKDVDRDLGS